MKTIWVIERGSYSDYGVVGVYATKAQAKAVVARMDTAYDEPSIAEWPFCPDIEDIEANRKQFTVRFKEDGNGYTVDEKEHYEQTDGYRWNHGHSYTVFADNVETAVKIASEKVFQYLAEKRL